MALYDLRADVRSGGKSLEARSMRARDRQLAAADGSDRGHASGDRMREERLKSVIGSSRGSLT